jgi:subtilisin family serine protease
MRTPPTPVVAAAAAFLLAWSFGASAQLGARLAGNPYRVALEEPVQTSRIDRRLHGASGPVDVWVSLEQNSVAAQRTALAEAAGMDSSDRAVLRASSALRQGAGEHRQRVRASQAELAGRLAALGGQELARVHNAHNAIAVRIDAAQLPQLATLAGVAKVRPVLHYRLALAETVPYVGGAAVQARGFDGSGVKVAVLDSGIDYTHKNLGGPGTAAAYAAAYGAGPSDPKNTTLDGLFPTAKVVAGFDFVGEQWPNCAPNTDCRSEDPDPIDFEGHGTHVADIIAGRSLDGTRKGVAPGAKLVAVKVCSAVASSCNGIALLKGMDFALDPNGDGDTSDAVDVINMSLGSDYGQIEDDLSLAATNAIKLGVVVVTSAGNGGNKPYVVGSPSIAPGVISVAQTQVPSARAFPLVINAPAAIAGAYPNTETLAFAPVGNGVSGNVARVGRGCPAGSIAAGSPEDPYLDSPAGKIALIDRGACAVSLKVDRAVKAGATGVLIGLVAPGDAISFSFAGGTSFAPSLVIQQVLSNSIKAQLTAGQTVNVTISPAAAIALVGGMANSSARGPSISLQSIKPEIGAPGASLSAEAGTGDGQTAFGGTSGAAPMVAGAVALLLQAHPHRSPAQIKAMLMNSAETTVYSNLALLPGELAPITRIGAGELRVNRALDIGAIAWNRKSKSAALSFGAVEAAGHMVVEQTLVVQNLSHHDKHFTVTPSFRYANDAASGAVRVLTRSRLHVRAGGREELEVKLLIDPSRLPEWTLNGGPLGGNGAALNVPEFDGYITLTDGGLKLSVPWHVLPRKAAAATAHAEHGAAGPAVRVRNAGAETSVFDVFSLTGVSRKIPRSELPAPGDAFAVVDIRSVGVRYVPAVQTGLDFDILEFAINTNGRRAHPNYPAEFDVFLDTTGDGVADYVVFNAELGGFSATGQNAVAVADLNAGGPARAFFFTDADLNSGNVIMTVPLNWSGGGVKLTAGATVAFDVVAFDNYFTGNLTDLIEGMRFTPGKARFAVASPFGAVASGGNLSVPVTRTSRPDTLSSEIGVLMMLRRNAGREAEALRLRP